MVVSGPREGGWLPFGQVGPVFKEAGMSAAEMQKTIEQLQEQVQVRDRLLRMAYYAVRQIRNPKTDRLCSEMAPWAPIPTGRPL